MNGEQENTTQPVEPTLKELRESAASQGSGPG